MASCGGSPGKEPAALTLERTITLPNVSGRIDHLAIDLKHDRLFVAELGNGSVDMVDLARGIVAHRITGFKEPQGVAYLPDRDELAVASGGDGTVRFYRGADAVPAGIVQLGEDADNLRVDPRNGRLVAGYGSGALAVIDPATRTVVGRLMLPGHPEGFRLTDDTALINVPDHRTVVKGNIATGATEAGWRATHRLNFPMAFDPASNRAATVYRWPARLVIFDAGTGAVASDVATCGDADDVFFDMRRDRIMVSCGTGKVEVFARGTGSPRSLGTVATRAGARTALFVPERDRLYVAVRAAAAAPAEIRILRPN
ncbi:MULTISPECIES: YncE family protein [Sphingomonas]|uniref:YncE family protein n=1 Tax=Sphingomonas TaxID=13687 RepID=UPI001E31CE92|nr:MULTISPECIES: hypothetical protein [Sphingomonas]